MNDPRNFYEWLKNEELAKKFLTEEKDKKK
jgi:hypothetical protein